MRGLPERPGSVALAGGVGGGIAARSLTMAAIAADLTASYSVGTVTSDGQRFRVLRPHARGGLGAVFVALSGALFAGYREVRMSFTRFGYDGLRGCRG